MQYVKETPYLVGPIRMNVGSGCNFCPISSTDDAMSWLLLTLAQLHHTCNLYFALSDQTTHCNGRQENSRSMLIGKYSFDDLFTQAIQPSATPSGDGTYVTLCHIAYVESGKVGSQ